MDDPYLTQASVFIGDQEKVVVKLDKQTLKEVWRRRTRLHVRGGHGDLIFLGAFGEYQVWNPEGQMVWKRKLPANFARIDGRIYLVDGGLHVIDLATGETIERLNCPPGAPDLLDGDLLLLTCPESPEKIDPVRLFHVRERRIVWEKSLLSEIRDRYQDECRLGLVLFPGRSGNLVASSGRHLFGISLADGGLKWAVPINVPYLSPQMRDGRIYVWATAATTSNKTVTVDLASGQVTREQSEPVEGVHRFVIVDEASGQIVSDRPLAPFGALFRRFQEPMRGTLCKHHIAFTTRTGLIALFRLSDGELVWHHEHRDELFCPVFEGNRLYTASADGTLVVFEAEGGEL